jgi:hypothetical protein
VTLKRVANAYLRIERRYSRKSRYYDIVRKESGESAIWLDATSDLNIAESRIEELTGRGEFQIMDQQNHQIVEKIITPSDRPQGVISWTKGFLQGYEQD